ncbi:MAG: thioredoxin domain-containing protein [Bellilinea sp.]|jgi:thioredoxin 1
MRSIKAIHSAEFDNKVLAASVPVLVEFGAVWCGPCRRLEMELEQLQTELAGRLDVVSLDVDEASDLMMKYAVMSVPTLLLFKQGGVTKRVGGLHPLERLKGMIEPFLPIQL